MTRPSEPPSKPADLSVELAAATELVIEPGHASDTHPYTEQPELLGIRDVEVVQQLVVSWPPPTSHPAASSRRWTA